MLDDKIIQIKEEKPSKTIGQRLKDLREAKKLSREEVAAAIEISVSALRRMENGDYDQPIEGVMRLAMFYGVTLNFIILGVSDGADNFSA